MSYFRKFIRNYAQVAKPLTDLTRGNPQKITWSKIAQDSLDHLKKALTSEPILSLPDFQTGQFVVTTDASTKGHWGDSLPNNKWGRKNNSNSVRFSYPHTRRK